MKVRLTHPQWMTVRRRISDDLVEAMIELRSEAIGRAHDYLLPAIGWRRVLTELEATAYGPIGGSTQGPESLYRAISKIANAVATIENHPALTLGKGVMGVSADVIPAWRLDDVSFSPYPMMMRGEFVVLFPELHGGGQRIITVWRPRPPGSQPESVLHEEILHLRLGRRVDA